MNLPRALVFVLLVAAAPVLFLNDTRRTPSSTYRLPIRSHSPPGRAYHSPPNGSYHRVAAPEINTDVFLAAENTVHAFEKALARFPYLSNRSAVELASHATNYTNSLIGKEWLKEYFALGKKNTKEFLKGPVMTWRRHHTKGTAVPSSEYADELDPPVTAQNQLSPYLDQHRVCDPLEITPFWYTGFRAEHGATLVNDVTITRSSQIARCMMGKSIGSSGTGGDYRWDKVYHIQTNYRSALWPNGTSFMDPLLRYKDWWKGTPLEYIHMARKVTQFVRDMLSLMRQDYGTQFWIGLNYPTKAERRFALFLFGLDMLGRNELAGQVYFGHGRYYKTARYKEYVNRPTSLHVLPFKPIGVMFEGELPPETLNRIAKTWHFHDGYGSGLPEGEAIVNLRPVTPILSESLMFSNFVYWVPADPTCQIHEDCIGPGLMAGVGYQTPYWLTPPLAAMEMFKGTDKRVDHRGWPVWAWGVEPDEAYTFTDQELASLREQRHRLGQMFLELLGEWGVSRKNNPLEPLFWELRKLMKPAEYPLYGFSLLLNATLLELQRGVFDGVMVRVMALFRDYPSGWVDVDLLPIAILGALGHPELWEQLAVAWAVFQAEMEIHWSELRERHAGGKSEWVGRKGKHLVDKVKSGAERVKQGVEWVKGRLGAAAAKPAEGRHAATRTRPAPHAARTLTALP